MQPTQRGQLLSMWPTGAIHSPVTIRNPKSMAIKELKKDSNSGFRNRLWSAITKNNLLESKMSIKKETEKQLRNKNLPFKYFYLFLS